MHPFFNKLVHIPNSKKIRRTNFYVRSKALINDIYEQTSEFQLRKHDIEEIQTVADKMQMYTIKITVCESIYFFLEKVIDDTTEFDGTITGELTINNYIPQRLLNTAHV